MAPNKKLYAGDFDLRARASPSPALFFLPRIMAGTFMKSAFLEAHVPVFLHHFIAFLQYGHHSPHVHQKTKGLTCIGKKRQRRKGNAQTKRAPRREPGSIRAMEGTR